MTLTLKLEVPDTGAHTVMVVVTERPENPFLTDQHVNLRRETYDVDPSTHTVTRIK